MIVDIIHKYNYNDVPNWEYGISNVKLDKYNDTTDEYDFQEDEVEEFECKI